MDQMAESIVGTRDIAMAAQAQINAHEMVCAERWKESKLALERLEMTFRSMQTYGIKAVAWILIALASGLAGTIWWIVTHPSAQP